MFGHRKALLDLDGCARDFIAATMRLFGITTHPYDSPELHGTLITSFWGIPDREFWGTINAQGTEFWANAPKTPFADELVATLTAEFGEDNIAILTSPAFGCGHAVLGGRQWIEQNFPQFRERIIWTAAKEFCASPARVLIDDQDKNVQAFAEAGGLGILVPGLWNRLHRDAYDPMPVVRDSLRTVGLWDTAWKMKGQG